jgi:hypothetical protein
MDRACQRCSTPFVAKRSTAKYCGDKCRTLAAKERKRDAARVVPVKPEPRKRKKKADADSPPPAEAQDAPNPPTVLLSTMAAVVAELTTFKRLHSVHGQAAVQLAMALDHPAETGSAKAALAKQLAATMELALAGVTVAKDPVDELAGRRAKRAGA